MSETLGHIEVTEDSMLTTIDNPYDPFTEYDAWLRYDISKGYNTNGLLARFVRTSPNLSDSIQEDDITLAMKRVLELNVYGVHKIVNRKD